MYRNSAGHSQLCGSQNYVWCTGDVLGQGATGAVYKARHKKTGELHAVKTFNEMGHRRPLQVQMREFDVLRKLNHKNIVKLLAIEEEVSTRSKVIVMELCTGGSLYNMLDDPENAYGLPEEEFFTVLKDVAEGLKHLRDVDIVHRDIKPGNIMRYLSEDGSSVYKLTDFGAARELQEEEQFMSLYGTEEYLYPDMYERAVLHRPTAKQFGAAVDLWSLGVTSYHVASGQLPFRPYGGRKNRETMFRITTEKASGVISGVQHSENGAIEWSRQLPKFCRLSQGARNLVTPLLAGLMEVDPEKMMSFDKFFADIHQITQKKCIYVMSMCTCKPLHVYVDRNQSLAKLQELITEQSDIHASKQYLVYDNCPLTKIIQPLQAIDTYPETSFDKPIFLFCVTNQPFMELQALEIPSFPPFSTGMVLDSDAAIGKQCCGILYLHKRYMQDITRMHLFLNAGIWQYLMILLQDLDHVRYYVGQFVGLCEEGTKRLAYFLEAHSFQMRMLDMLVRGLQDEAERDNLAQNRQRLISMTSDLTQVTQEMRRVCETMRGTKEEVDTYYNRIEARKDVSSKWSDYSTDKDKNVLKMVELVKNVRAIMENFRRDRSIKRLNFNDEQIHKFDRQKMTEMCTKSVSLLDHCYMALQREFDKFNQWFSSACQMRTKLTGLETQVSQMVEKLHQSSRQLNQVTPDYTHILEESIRRVENKTVNLSQLAPPLGGDAPPPLPPRNSPSPNSMRSRRSSSKKAMMKQIKDGLKNLHEETKSTRSTAEEGQELMRQLEVLSFSNAFTEDSLATSLQVVSPISVTGSAN